MNTQRSCTTQTVSDLITRSLAIAQKVCHSKENNGGSIEILTWKKGTIQLMGKIIPPIANGMEHTLFC